jgi:Mg-chelatase subunit ChlD/surface antigen
MRVSGLNPRICFYIAMVSLALVAISLHAPAVGQTKSEHENGGMSINDVTIEARLLTAGAGEDNESHQRAISPDVKNLDFEITARSANADKKSIIAFLSVETLNIFDPEQRTILWTGVQTLRAGSSLNVSIPAPTGGFPPGFVIVILQHKAISGTLLSLRVEGETVAGGENPDEQTDPIPSGDDLAEGDYDDTTEPLPPDTTTESGRRDLLDSQAGAWVISSSSHYDADWHPRFLLDGSVAKGWSSAQGKAYPNEIMFELDGIYDLEEFVVDSTNAQEEQWPGISAKDFELHVSVTSAESGFERVLAATAGQGARSAFALDAPVKARWLKLVVLSNWGHPEYTEIMELSAYGEAAPKDDGDVGALVETYPDRAPEEKPASPKVVFELPKGQVHALVTTEPKAKPLTPMAEIPEDSKEIFVPVWSESEGAVRVIVDLIATDVPGIGQDVALGRRDYLFIVGERQNFRFELNGLPPAEGYTSFPPGAYRAEVTIEGGPSRSLPFEVVSTLPSAELANAETVPNGLNIALEALGGRIENFTSEREAEEWSVRYLIDGLPIVQSRKSNRCQRCGWSSADNVLPQSFVFSFHEGREAQVEAVVIDPRAGDSRKDVALIPKHVEVWASSTGPSDGFARIAEARLQRRAEAQVIRFPPTPARFIRVVFASNYGGAKTQAGEIEIIETAEAADSIVGDRPRNLASPTLGGALVRYSSQRDERVGAHAVIDGDTDAQGWRSKDDYLPQDFVFAFRQNQSAFIERITLHPKSGHAPETWPKTVSVAVSSTGPLKGFEETGVHTLSQDPGAQDVPVGREARYVRLRILENFGGKFTSLGELEVIEGRQAGGRSVLLTMPVTEAFAGPDERSDPELGAPVEREEREPNDGLEDANALELGQFTRGRIDRTDDLDHFRLDLPEGQTSVLTIDLAGQPNIRTSVSLLDGDGEIKKHFDPGTAQRDRTSFSWAVDGRESYLKLAEPPVYVVLIWDTSGSMEGSTEDLERAVTAYVDNLRPGEQVNLIRFSDRVEVLLPEFSNDQDRLRAAIQGKFREGGSTALYDAIAEGAKLLEQVTGNKAILVMTDGADSASELDHTAFWRLLGEQRIRLYAIGLGQDMRNYLTEIATSGDRVLSHIALATNGRFLFASTSEELSAFYEKVSEELHRTARYYIKPSIAPGLGHLSVTSTGERIVKVSAPRIELILDASGSMREKNRRIDGKLKIDVAKQVLAQIIDGLPEDAQVALRVYGHRIREGRKGDCEDSELVVPFGKSDKSKLLQQVQRIRALGTTPLAYSIRQAARDFGDSDGEKVIVLVTDGKEECGERPQDTVAELRDSGVDLRLNVVGFALADEEVKLDMRETAALSGGRFFDAQDGDGLQAALEQALAAPFDVIDASDTVVASGITGQSSVAVPEGVYTVVVQATGEPITIPEVRVAYDRYTKVELKKEGREIGAEAVGPVTEQEAAWFTQEPAAPDVTPEPHPDGSEPDGEESMPPKPDESAPAEPDRELVRSAQMKLAQLGFAPGPADGAAGPRTIEALRSFQKAAGLPADGQISDQLLGQLEEALTGARYISYGTEDTLVGRSFSNRLRGALARSDLLKIQTSYSFALQALDTGEVITWNNPETGASGKMTLAKSSHKQKGKAKACRSFVHSITARGRSERSKETLLACQSADGAWHLAD